MYSFVNFHDVDEFCQNLANKYAVLNAYTCKKKYSYVSSVILKCY